MNFLERLSTEESRDKKWIDAFVSIVIGILIIFIGIVSKVLWDTKGQPFVKLTVGHIIFPITTIGLYLTWFLKIRRYPIEYLGFRRAKKKFWYFISPLGAFIGFGFGIPTFILITNMFPQLGGGGMAGTPPELGYPIILVLLVETFKYPIVSVIPHNIAWRGAVFTSLRSMRKGYLLLAFLISTAFYVVYHLSFDYSFSAIYFNTIWNTIAIFLFVKSESLYPPMIFHSTINYISILISWGLYTFK